MQCVPFFSGLYRFQSHNFGRFKHVPKAHMSCSPKTTEALDCILDSNKIKEDKTGQPQTSYMSQNDPMML